VRKLVSAYQRESKKEELRQAAKVSFTFKWKVSQVKEIKWFLFVCKIRLAFC